ncbi:MAG TPA: nicotinate-nucleotide--dimethylbenzimidazole phosphoribosyltransferase, partial [Polyangia bacterium]|nr:nicotinate-nucleotide--dimethylbenzimidazole phosphoribosyltransferase [Polyangia bacterium]
ARESIYSVIEKRRDIRLFTKELKVSDDVLDRILGAAHLAPSVGYSQPWDFVIVRDVQTRARIRASFLRCRDAEAARYSPERREKYLAYQLEGIVDAPLNLCVTVDLRPAEEVVLGTSAQPEALRWSACCAVQNLWLAARAEGVGVGWVSIVEPAVLRAELGLPAGIEPVAYLCVGYPVEFPERPMLEQTGWRARRPLADAKHEGRYRVAASNRAASAPEKLSADLMAPPPPFDEGAAAAVRARQLRLTKPAGSLGRLEELAAWYAGARGRSDAAVPEVAEIVVFAGDHGVAALGVSAYPSSITAAMVGNFLAGGAAINALAGVAGIALTVVDIGVAGDLSALPAERRARFVAAKVRAGTGNFVVEPAMSRAEAEAALGVGVAVADEAAGRGVALLGVGEMGIANTTPAAALLAVLADRPPEETVGRGAGLDDRGVVHKASVIRDALARHRPDRSDPVGVLCAVGGLEIAGMAGLMLGAARRRLPVVVDGFISTVAALVAVRLVPEVRGYLCFAHLSSERGHRLALELLQATPLLDLALGLGEGTGAALAIPLCRAAVAAQLEMATFATAGITERVGPASVRRAR